MGNVVLDIEHIETLKVASSMSTSFFYDRIDSGDGNMPIIFADGVALTPQIFFMFWFWAHAGNPIFKKNYLNNQEVIQEFVELNHDISKQFETNISGFVESVFYNKFTKIYKAYEESNRENFISTLISELQIR